MCTTAQEAEEVSQYFNVSDAEIGGLELNGDWQVTPALKANANYTYTHSEQKMVSTRVKR